MNYRYDKIQRSHNSVDDSKSPLGYDVASISKQLLTVLSGLLPPS